MIADWSDETLRATMETAAEPNVDEYVAEIVRLRGALASQILSLRVETDAWDAERDTLKARAEAAEAQAAMSDRFAEGTIKRLTAQRDALASQVAALREALYRVYQGFVSDAAGLRLFADSILADTSKAAEARDAAVRKASLEEAAEFVSEFQANFLVSVPPKTIASHLRALAEAKKETT